MTVGSWLWGVAIVALVICVVIQHSALNRIAFSRSMFITGMAFVCSFVVTLTLPSAAVWVVFTFFQVVAWGFLLLITLRSIARLRARKR